MQVADGVSSSEVSHIASQATVKAFLEDYFCTSPAWSVRKSAQRVLMAVNSWLYAQTRQSQYRYERDRGCVCTLSAMVIKSTTAHLFHVGDSQNLPAARRFARAAHRRPPGLGSRTRSSYLGRALGVNPQLEIDYQAATVEAGDVFILATDGVHEFVDRPVHHRGWCGAIRDDLDQRGQGARQRSAGAGQRRQSHPATGA